jgi:hypothetical protein
MRAAVIAGALTLVGLGLVASAPPAGAVDVVVTTTADGGAGSLRDAVDQVNADGGIFNSITLTAGETYTLDTCPAMGNDEDANADGDLDFVDTTVSVFGNGATIEQTCAGERVAHVFGASVAFFDVVFTGGDAAGVGGGLFVDDDATPASALLDSVTIVGNHADGNGGGVYSNGAQTLVEAVNTTITGNDGNAGGGWFIAFPSVANIRFSTIADNSSVTGIGSNLNGGSGGSILATVLAEPNGGDNCSGTPSSEGYNYADETCFWADGDATDENAGGPALLGAPADNGGSTPTMLPAAGSPLLDRVALGAGACGEAPEDQRDVVRPQGDLCDTGAVEVEVDDPGPGPGPGTEPEPEPPTDVGPISGAPAFTG